MRWGCLGLWIAAIAVAACCPPPEPQQPRSAPPPAKATAARTTARTIPPAKTTAARTTARTIPPAILSRFERPNAAPVKLPAKEREMLKEPPLVPPERPKQEIQSKRETLAPPAPRTEIAARLPDDVVMRLLETNRAAFVRCFKKAVAADPLTLSFKVRIRVELDDAGAITSSSADTSDPALAGCLTRATAWIRFPGSGQRVVVELPLFYRGE